LVDLIARVDGVGGGGGYKGIEILLATHGYAVIGPPPLHTILKARTKETNKQTHKQTNIQPLDYVQKVIPSLRKYEP
jgi:hypothetical protein